MRLFLNIFGFLLKRFDKFWNLQLCINLKVSPKFYSNIYIYIKYVLLKIDIKYDFHYIWEILSFIILASLRQYFAYYFIAKVYRIHGNVAIHHRVARLSICSLKFTDRVNHSSQCSIHKRTTKRIYGTHWHCNIVYYKDKMKISINLLFSFLISPFSLSL